jgi:hypothetical protein
MLRCVGGVIDVPFFEVVNRIENGMLLLLFILVLNVSS